MTGEPLRNFIAGEWRKSLSAETRPIVNPATEERVGLVPVGSPEDVAPAVEAARQAQHAWGALPVEERVEALRRTVDVIENHVAELAELERLDMGRPVELGTLFLTSATEAFRADIGRALEYPFESSISFDGSTKVVRRPLGVAAVLLPWNFTVANLLLVIGPVLASGNTAVVKPSEKSPLSAVRLFELAKGLPDGIINLIQGDGRVGQPLVTDPGVDAVYLTGSVQTGRAVNVAAASGLRRVVLELGGKDPVVVDADVNPVETARDVALGAFANSGQICTSMERIYVHESIAAAFIAALVGEARKISLGEGAFGSLGPLVDGDQRDLVHRHVLDAVEHGAVVEIGGIIPGGRGFFYPPTVLTNVTDSMLIMTEETFGPIAPVLVVQSFEEGLERACKTDFGLAATIYTNTRDHARAAESLPAGLVWINRWQGSAEGQIYEPAKSSGLCATGGMAAYDAATRPSTISLAN